MKHSTSAGNTAGWTGVALLLASWTLLRLPSSLVTSRWDPWLFLIAIILSGPGAAVAGVLAARMASKWWYVLVGAGILSAAVLLAAVAV
jgi:hypothetical protein